MTGVSTLSETTFEDLLLLYRGKVRDVYQVDGDTLLLVATDRISAFDCILPTPIENKGAVLTSLSSFWFERLAHITGNHLITADVSKYPSPFRETRELLEGRSMLVKRARMVPHVRRLRYRTAA